MLSIGYILLWLQTQMTQSYRQPKREGPVATGGSEATSGRKEPGERPVSPDSPVDPSNSCARGEWVKMTDLKRNLSCFLRDIGDLSPTKLILFINTLSRKTARSRVLTMYGMQFRTARQTENREGKIETFNQHRPRGSQMLLF